MYNVLITHVLDSRVVPRSLESYAGCKRLLTTLDAKNCQRRTCCVVLRFKTPQPRDHDGLHRANMRRCPRLIPNTYSDRPCAWSEPHMHLKVDHCADAALQITFRCPSTMSLSQWYQCLRNRLSEAPTRFDPPRRIILANHCCVRCVSAIPCSSKSLWRWQCIPFRSNKFNSSRRLVTMTTWVGTGPLCSRDRI